jgi:hypothetical protein
LLLCHRDDTEHIALIVFAAGVVYYNLTYSQPQGRLLFPALGPFAVLLETGLESYCSNVKRRSRRNLIWAIFIAVLLAIDIVTLYQTYHFYHDCSQYIS